MLSCCRHGGSCEAARGPAQHTHHKEPWGCPNRGNAHRKEPFGLPSTSLRITSMAAAASDDVALAVDAPRQCATPAAATPRPEAAFDNSFFTAGCEKVTERDAHKSTFGLRQLMYAPDDRHDVAVLNIADLERLDERRDRIRHRGIERRCTWWCTLQGTVVTDVLRSPFFFASFGSRPARESIGAPAADLRAVDATSAHRCLRRDALGLRQAGEGAQRFICHGADGAGRVPLVRVDLPQQRNISKISSILSRVGEMPGLHI